MYGKNMFFECPSFNVKKCVDPTGAGDTFAGAFIGHLNNVKTLSFDEMKLGVIKACAMASFCVEDFGVNNIIHKNESELESRIQYLKKLINI